MIMTALLTMPVFMHGVLVVFSASEFDLDYGQFKQIHSYR